MVVGVGSTNSMRKSTDIEEHVNELSTAVRNIGVGLPKILKSKLS